MSAEPADQTTVARRPEKTHFEAAVRLPGYGDPPNRCRDYSPVGFCEHGHTILGRSSCGTRYCPDHWRDWCEDAVISLVARLAAYRWAQENGADRRLVHVVASPPQNRRYSVRELWDTRTDAYEALEAAGVRGGVTVTHPYRTTDHADRMFETASEEGQLEDGTGKWDFLRSVTDGWGELEEYIEAAPHYHALAPAVDVSGEAAPDGWIVENIQSLTPMHHLRDSEVYEDMAAAAYYVLTHGAVQDGRATTTYFGEVHPSNFDPEEAVGPTAWRRIQEEAEAAVKEYGDEEEGGAGGGPTECPRDGCEAAVRDLVHLSEYLADEEWKAQIRTLRDGRERLVRLRGAFIHFDGRADRPPPSAVTSKDRFEEWLESVGRLHTPAPKQVGLLAPSD